MASSISVARDAEISGDQRSLGGGVGALDAARVVIGGSWRRRDALTTALAARVILRLRFCRPTTSARSLPTSPATSPAKRQSTGELLSTPKPRSRGYGAPIPRRRISASRNAAPSNHHASPHRVAGAQGAQGAPRKLRGFHPLRGTRVQALWSQDPAAGYFNGTVISGPSWSHHGDTWGVAFDDGDQDGFVLLRWVRLMTRWWWCRAPPPSVPGGHARRLTTPASSSLPYSIPPPPARARHANHQCDATLGGADWVQPHPVAQVGLLLAGPSGKGEAEGPDRGRPPTLRERIPVMPETSDDWHGFEHG